MFPERIPPPSGKTLDARSRQDIRGYSRPLRGSAGETCACVCDHAERGAEEQTAELKSAGLSGKYPEALKAGFLPDSPRVRAVFLVLLLFVCLL